MYVRTERTDVEMPPPSSPEFRVPMTAEITPALFGVFMKVISMHPHITTIIIHISCFW